MLEAFQNVETKTYNQKEKRSCEMLFMHLNSQNNEYSF